MMELQFEAANHIAKQGRLQTSARVNMKIQRDNDGSTSTRNQEINLAIKKNANIPCKFRLDEAGGCCCIKSSLQENFSQRAQWFH